MAKNGNLRFLLLKLIFADKVEDQLADLPPPAIDILWPRVELTWADQVEDLPPC